MMYYMADNVAFPFRLPKRSALYLSKLEIQNPQPKLNENGD